MIYKADNNSTHTHFRDPAGLSITLKAEATFQKSRRHMGGQYLEVSTSSSRGWLQITELVTKFGR